MADKHEAARKRAQRHLEKAHEHHRKAHEEILNLEKYRQDEKDRKDEARGMRKAMERSPAQRKALKGKSKKERDLIKGGEKANKKLREEHKRGRGRPKKY